jgi:membrane protease subunit HflC
MKWYAAGALMLTVVAVTGTTALVVVEETEQVVVTRFGRPVGRVISTPGLHVTSPLHGCTVFDTRVLVWEDDSIDVVTTDDQRLRVSVWALWRVSDPLLLLRTVGDECGATFRIHDVLVEVVTNAVAASPLENLVESTGMRTSASLPDAMATSGRPLIRGGLEAEILTRAAERTEGLGFELLEVRFRRICLLTVPP